MKYLKTFELYNNTFKQDEIIEESKVSELLDEYYKLTDINDHTGAALVIARSIGTEEDVQTLVDIENKNKKGYLTKEEIEQRDAIGNKYYYILKKYKRYEDENNRELLK